MNMRLNITTEQWWTLSCLPINDYKLVDNIERFEHCFFLAITASSPWVEKKLLSSNELRICYDTLQDRKEQFQNLVL
jgi:hypothetical protein